MLRLATSSAFRSQAARLSVAAQPPQTRTLVSSVLLTRDLYNDRKVLDLKTELKQRGLSTSGRREELIRRLLQDDIRKAGGGGGSGNGAKNLQTGGARSKATLASLRDSDKKKGGTAAAAAPKGNTGASSAANDSAAIPKPTASKEEKAAKLTSASASQGDLVIDPSVVVSIGGGSRKPFASPNVVAAATSVSADDIPPLKEPESNPPGVPPQDLPKVPNTFKYVIPYEKPAPVHGAEIPLVTAYTSPGAAADRFAKKAAEEKLRPLRKVIAVAGTSTMPGGGISSAAHDAGLSDAGDSEAHTYDSPSSASSSSPLQCLLSDVCNDLGANAAHVERQASKVAGDVSKAVSTRLSELSESVRAFSSSSSSSSSAPSASASSSSSSSGRSKSRPLDEHERTGSYVLGAILASGFVLGGLGKKPSALSADVQEPATLVQKAVSKASDKVAASTSESTDARGAADKTFSAGKGRVGKALGDLKVGVAAGNGAGAAADTNRNFASAAGIVGGGPRKV